MDASRWPPRTVLVIAFALSVAVAALDLATGPEISFSIFYVVPVGLAAWAGATRAGYFLASWSGVLWLVADLLHGKTYSHPLIPFWNAGVRLGFFLLIAHLLARLQGTLALLKEQANRDPLTDLPNARRFRELLEAEMDRARRYPKPFTLAYLDLDNFKEVNDSRGHMEGDRVLREVSRVMKASVRKTDLVARVGGDEFCIHLPETGEEGGRKGLEKLQEEVSGLVRREGWPISLSLGAVTFLQVPSSLEEGILRADRLMYRVKTRGKNAMLLEVAEVEVPPESPGPRGP